MNPLRIALASPYDWAVPGGVNEHIRFLARHLRARGHTVSILAPVSDPTVWEEGLVGFDTSIVSIPFGGAVARVTLSPSIWGEARDHLRQHPYDIVHAHEPTVPLLPPAVLRASRAVNVGTFHQNRDGHPGYEWGRALAQYFVGRLHGRIAVSPAARAFIEGYFPGDYRIIPNGIEVADFQDPALQPWPEFWGDGKLNILFLGRLEQRKGFRYLLRAFRLVKEAVPEARLLVAGAYDRDDRLPFVRYARHFRLRDVRFVGYVPPADKPRWYRTAHLFCAPSTGSESFGIVLTEAMAAGVPIVASDIAGYRDVVQHGVTGELVPPEDEGALAEAITRLLLDPARRDHLRRAARRAVQHYDWARVSLEIESFYHELLEHELKLNQL